MYSLSALAADDLDRIIDYTVEHFPSRARATAKELLDVFSFLGNNPTIGTHRDDLNASCRTWPVLAFVIIFREVDDGVEILRIAHGHQRLEALAFSEQP